MSTQSLILFQPAKLTWWKVLHLSSCSVHCLMPAFKRPTEGVGSGIAATGLVRISFAGTEANCL